MTTLGLHRSRCQVYEPKMLATYWQPVAKLEMLMMFFAFTHRVDETSFKPIQLKRYWR